MWQLSAAQNSRRLSKINWKTYTHRWPTDSTLQLWIRSWLVGQLPKKKKASSCYALLEHSIWLRLATTGCLGLPFNFIIASGTRCSLSRQVGTFGAPTLRCSPLLTYVEKRQSVKFYPAYTTHVYSHWTSHKSRVDRAEQLPGLQRSSS